MEGGRAGGPVVLLTSRKPRSFHGIKFRHFPNPRVGLHFFKNGGIKSHHALVSKSKMAAFPFFSFCSALLAISLGIFIQFNTKQPQPYMDEIFHIPQAQKYCHFKFKEWDPKITTLPGIYLVSFAGLRALSFFLGRELHLLCSTFFLRMTNVLFLMGNVWLLRQLLIHIHCSCDTKTEKQNKVG